MNNGFTPILEQTVFEWMLQPPCDCQARAMTQAWMVGKKQSFRGLKERGSKMTNTMQYTPITPGTFSVMTPLHTDTHSAILFSSVMTPLIY